MRVGFGHIDSSAQIGKSKVSTEIHHLWKFKFPIDGLTYGSGASVTIKILKRESIHILIKLSIRTSILFVVPI